MDLIDAQPSSSRNLDRRSPTVSICVPTYNGARFLSECLDSALAQTWRDFEIVIVDDQSTDGTLEIAAAYAAREPRITLHQNDRNLGLAGNWNQCVHLSRGQWIKFLFQDDYLEDTCLSRMLASRRPDVPLIAVRRVLAIEADTPPDIREFYESHASTNMLRNVLPGLSFVSPREFTAQVADRPTMNCIGEPTVTLIHRAAFERFGAFNPNFKVLTDWEFLARIAVHHGLCYIDEELAAFRVHPRSTTQTELGRSAFRALDLDALIMLHELAYSATFEPVRDEIAHRRYAMDFRFRLAREVRSARRKAERWARARGEANGEARANLATLLRTYPRLAHRPRGYVMASLTRLLRQARWKVARRVEVVLLGLRRAMVAVRRHCL